MSTHHSLAAPSSAAAAAALSGLSPLRFSSCFAAFSASFAASFSLALSAASRAASSRCCCFSCCCSSSSCFCCCLLPPSAMAQQRRKGRCHAKLKCGRSNPKRCEGRLPHWGANLSSLQMHIYNRLQQGDAESAGACCHQLHTAKTVEHRGRCMLPHVVISQEE
jgi:hypothetical protein